MKIASKARDAITQHPLTVTGLALVVGFCLGLFV